MDREKCLEVAFEIINYGGTAKGCAYEALNSAENGDFEKADKLMKEADEQLLQAHHIQTELIAAETRGEYSEIGVLFVHAQDHLMTAIESKSLIERLITMYRKMDMIWNRMCEIDEKAKS